MSNPNKKIVNISRKNWNILQNYSRYAFDKHNSEIGGYLVVKRDPETKELYLDEPVILEQEISLGNTVIDKSALGVHLMKVKMKYLNEEFYYCWWHSHHNMTAFWSGTDLDAIQQGKNSSYQFNLVINLKGEYVLRCNMWHPVEAYIDSEEHDGAIELVIEPEQKTIPKYIKDKVDKLCSKPKPVTKIPATTHYYHGGYNWGSHNGQTTLFPDKELVQLEAELDNILQDYAISKQTVNEYKIYEESVVDLNSKLEKEKSQYRVGICSHKTLDNVVITANADEYIHNSDEKWSDEKILEDNFDTLKFNSGWGGNV